MKTNNFSIISVQEQININESIINERNNEIKKIHQDIIHINEIYHDLNKLIAEQNNDIILLEQNIIDSKKKVEQGTNELYKAEKYYNSWFSNKQKFILLSIAGITINAPITMLFGVKAGVVSGLSTIGLSAMNSLFSK